MFDIFRRKKKEEEKPEEIKEEAAEEPMLLDEGKVTEEKNPNKKSPDELEGKEENKRIIEVMKKVQDPELGLDIWTLGLVYDINAEGNNAGIKMTFTTPMCPYGPMIVAELKSGLKGIGIENPKIEIVFEPLWQPSEEVRNALGV